VRPRTKPASRVPPAISRPEQTEEEDRAAAKARHIEELDEQVQAMQLEALQAGESEAGAGNSGDGAGSSSNDAAGGSLAAPALPPAMERMCVVCLDEAITHVFAPCGHLCTCANCGDAIMRATKLCPICRHEAQMCFKTFAA
jgi:hypothetical protein